MCLHKTLLYDEVNKNILLKNCVHLYIAESPGPPSDVRVSNVTNTSAVLSWSPSDNGGGRPLYEIVYTVTATGECVCLSYPSKLPYTVEPPNKGTNDFVPCREVVPISEGLLSEGPLYVQFA